MKRQAVVLGGTSDHIRLIELLQSKGFYTILIDYYENPPAKKVADEHVRESTLDFEKVLRIAKDRSVDLVVSACIDQALLTMAYVCEKLGLPCHVSYDTALELTNKAYMKKKFIENNIPTSRYVLTSNTLDYDVSDLIYPLVVKPADANSSKGIKKVDSETALKAAVGDAYNISRSKEVVIEEFCEGEEFSVDIIVKNSVPTLVMATKNIKNKRNSQNFTIVQNLYPATESPIVLEKILQVAKQIIKAYGIKNSPLLIQILHKKGRMSVVEFSARIGGGSKYAFINKITSFDILQYFIDILLDTTHGPKVLQKYKYGAMSYTYTSEGTIHEFVGFDRLKEKKVINDFFLYKTVGMRVESLVASTDRAAGFLIVDNNLASFNDRVHLAEKETKILNEKGLDIKARGLW